VIARIDVSDPGAGHQLVWRLAEEINGATVAFDVERGQVELDVQKDSERALLAALGVVEEWLAAHGLGPTMVELDDQIYVLEPAVGVGGGG
jgi:hypothetical protein